MRNRLALLTAVAALAASLFALPGTDAAGPPTIVVDDDGLATPQSCNANVATPHTTIAGGVGSASANWVVKVCPGSYAMGNVVLPGIKGGLVVQGPRPQDARNRRLPDAREAVITSGQFVFAGVGQKVEGFAFTGATPIADAVGANAVRIQHNLFSGYTGTAISLDNIASGGNLIEKNRFIGLSNGASADAVEAENAGRLTIGNNGFENIDDRAVLLPTSSNVTISTNRAVNVGQFVVVDGGSNITVGSNTVTQTSAPGVPVLIPGPAVSIENSLGTVANVRVERNRMSYTVDDGIFVQQDLANPISGIVILSNTIDAPAGNGITVEGGGAGDVTVRSNSVRLAVGDGIYVGGPAVGLIIDRNRAAQSFGFDCFDGSDPTDNTWTYNAGRTRSPATICK